MAIVALTGPAFAELRRPMPETVTMRATPWRFIASMKGRVNRRY